MRCRAFEGEIGEDLADDRAELEAVAGEACADDGVLRLGVPANEEMLVRRELEQARLESDRRPGSLRQVALGERAQEFVAASGSGFYKVAVVAGRSYAIMAWAPYQDAGVSAVSLDTAFYTDSACTVAAATVDQTDREPSLSAGNHNGDAVSIIPTFTGTGDGWFQADGSVGYKSAFVRVDANLKETRGASSPRHILTNAITNLLAWTRAVAVATVTHTAHGFTTGDIIEVFTVERIAQVVT